MCLLWPLVLRHAVFFFLCLVSCNGRPSYYISIPANTIQGANTSMAVHWFGEMYSEITVTAEIFHNGNPIVSASKVFQNDSIGILTLPAIQQNFSSNFYTLVVNGSAQNTRLFSDTRYIAVGMMNISVLIQTDKPLYKAGENVKIRIITVKPDRKPHKGNVDLVIRDPRFNIVRQSLSMKSDLGVVSTEFTLSKNPILGSWSIQATCDGAMTNVYFSVIDYVEPKFYVTLDVPSFYIVPRQLNLSGTVIAKYFHSTPVNGSVKVSLKSYGSDFFVKGIDKIYEISGSANFSFAYTEFQNLWGPVTLEASVTENLTGVVVNDSANVPTVYEEYQLIFLDQPQFIPGENFTFKVEIQRFDNENLTKEEKSKVVSVRIIQLTGDYVTLNDTLQNYTNLESAIIAIQIPILQSTQILQAVVYYQNSSQKFYFSKSSGLNDFINLQISETVLKVGTPFNVQVETFPKVQDIYYVVMARGMIVSAGKNKTTFSLTPDLSWIPTAQLLVYYLNINGSFGSDIQTISQVFSVKPTLENKVTLSWSKNRAEPLENVSLSITVKESCSLVALKVAEKSSMLLGNRDDINASTVEDILRTNYMSYLSTLSDVNLNLNRYARASERESSFLPPTSKPIFPETWIWLDTNISSSLTTNLQLSVPNKNTTWVATAFVISETLGLGVMDTPIEISVIKPLITTLHTPSTLTRGEQCIVEVILFNSLKENLQVLVTLESSNSFDIMVPNNNTSTVPGQYNVTVPSEAGKIVLFPINPKKLGNATVKVTVTSKAGSEVLTNTILVKAEGVKYLYSQSALFDLTGNTSQTVSKNFSFTFPSDVISDTIEGFVTVVGDLLAPSINGLESLIQMPYGCGEQNMINFAPNIYVLLYLIATQRIKSDVRERAIDYMTQGYQRELTYKRDDGSFSAFGNSDPSGSTWLTAFVFRCFLQARPFIYINEDVLNGTVDWLVRYQDINTGIFSEPGRVIHQELQGGLNGPITLTAYIVTSLLEDEFYRHQYQSRIQKAVQYLESKYSEGITSNYTLSIVVYALSLANSSKAEAALNELNSRASITGNTKYWSTSSQQTNNFWQPRTTDIETAAYALLSYYKQGRILDGILVMKWLSEQRNHLGGYSSTQDTVMALQALSLFVPVVNFKEGATSLTLRVTGSGSFVPKTFQIDSSNNLLVLQRQQIEVPQPLLINVTAVGRGLAIFQLNLAYNRKTSTRAKRNSPAQQAFQLDVTVTEDKSNIQKLSVDVCTRYQGTYNRSGMVILDVGFLSGFKLSPTGIPTTDILKLVEPQDDKVYLYLDSVSTDTVCISVPLVRFSRVSSSQDAVVTIYEYYNPRNTATQTYNSLTMKNISYCDFCGSNCNQCKSNVPPPVKPKPNSSTKPTFYMLYLCVILISYLV
ncbi:CD109 antigen-like [Bufo bufo]|uniref:CD109 antigen-like n=1 Tax=Bufo bufo TaxID=8384 RepID=UPI001ABE6529|nr:CD109 antigen-like [Bufo bufo]